MTQQKLTDSLTVIVAALDDCSAFGDCLDGLKNWPIRIVVVSRKSPVVEKMIRGEGYEWVQHDSPCSISLWNKGLKHSTTSWNLIIHSNEVVSGRLKKSIEKKITQSCSTSMLYLPLSKIIFLKKVLKYPFGWSGEPQSGLLYKTDSGPDLTSIRKEAIEGELICLGETTVSLAYLRALDIAKSRRIRMCRKTPNLSKQQLILKTFNMAVYTLFVNVFSKQVLREGAEGLIFCGLDFYAYLISGIMYYEERIRGGGQIADQVQQIKKILVIKAMGIGDVVMATPVFRNIKNLLPHASLSVLVPTPVDKILKGNPYIDKLHSLPQGLTKKNLKTMIGPLIKEMNREKFDLIINLQSKNLSSLILKKVHAKWKINSSYYYRDKETNVLIGCETLKRSGIERDLDCLRQIGLEPKDKYPEIILEISDLDNAEKFFVNKGLDLGKKTIFIHPIASVGIREWGIDNFVKLCRTLVYGHKLQVIANASKSEMDRIIPIIQDTPEVVIFSGSVRDMLGIIKKCNLLIGNDSGPSHLSVAMGVPTIVFNGPSSANLYRDPDIYTDKHFVFNKEVPCRDLFQTQCYSYIDSKTNTPICQDQICLDFSVDEVVEKALELVK